MCWNPDAAALRAMSADLAAAAAGLAGSTVFLLTLMLLQPACIGAPDPIPPRPVAEAGQDTIVELGEAVVLQGGQSASPNGGELSFDWSFEIVPESSELTRDDILPNGTPEAKSSQFIPDVAGDYVLKLMVTDGVSQSNGDFVRISVEGSPRRPIADAGEDQSVQEGMAVYFDASESYSPEKKTLYYQWSLAGKPSLSTLSSADITNAYTPYPTLVVDAGGVFTLGLVVTDGQLVSDTDYVFITVDSTNAAPTALAGNDSEVESCTQVEVDGGSSYDPDGDLLTYEWSVLLAPLHSLLEDETLEGAHEPLVSFWADKTGDYVLQLVVADGEAQSIPATVHLTAMTRANNQPPAARAGEDQTLTEVVACTGAEPNVYCPACPAQYVTLSAEESDDPDDDELSFRWEVLEGDARIEAEGQAVTRVELQGATTTLGETTITEYRLQLNAEDCPGAVSSDEIVIRYQCVGGR